MIEWKEKAASLWTFWPCCCWLYRGLPIAFQATVLTGQWEDESADGLGRCADKLVCVEGLAPATVFRPSAKVLCRCLFPVGAFAFLKVFFLRLVEEWCGVSRLKIATVTNDTVTRILQRDWFSHWQRRKEESSAPIKMEYGIFNVTGLTSLRQNYSFFKVENFRISSENSFNFIGRRHRSVDKQMLLGRIDQQLFCYNTRPDVKTATEVNSVVPPKTQNHKMDSMILSSCVLWQNIGSN